MTEPERPSAEISTAVVVAALAFVATATFSPQLATLLLSGFAAAGAAARIVAPKKRAFVVRTKGVDVAILAVLAAALAYLGLSTPLG